MDNMDYEVFGYLRKKTRLKSKQSKKVELERESIIKAYDAFNRIEGTTGVDLSYAEKMEYDYRLLNMQLKKCGDYLNYLDEFEKQIKRGMIPRDSKRLSLEEFTMNEIYKDIAYRKYKEEKRTLRRIKRRTRQ